MQERPSVAHERRSTAIDLRGLSVCVVACHFHPETTGSSPYNSEMVRTLAASGAHVEVVTGVPHYPQWAVQDDKYLRGFRWKEKFHDIRITRVRHAVPTTPDLFGRARLEASFAALATPYVLASGSDMIVTVTPLIGAVLAAHSGRRGRPVGVVVHDLSGNGALQSGTTGSRAATAVTSMEYRLLRTADRVGIITPRFRDILIKEGQVSADRIVDLPLFTHISRVDVSSATARAHLGWTNTEDFLIVHTGNMGMKQGLDSVIDAARLAHVRNLNISFALVGDGNQRRTLIEQARDVPNLHFVDPVGDKDYPYVLAAADALLVNERPGVKEMSLPSKLTSYVAARRPIIAAVEPGGITHSTLEEFSAAHIVAVGNGEELLEGVLILRSDRFLSRSLVGAAVALGQVHYGEEKGRAAFRDFACELAGS